MFDFKISKRASKGVFNVDLIISAAIFIIGIIFFIQAISYTINSYRLEVDQEIRNNIAKSISIVLFESEGVPKDWYNDPATAKQLGLCVNFTKICLILPEKLTALDSLSADETKQILNLDDHEFRVSIKDNDNNLLYEYNSSDVSEKIGVYQYRCLLIDDSLTQVITTVQVW